MFCSTVRVGNRVVHGSPVAKVFKVIGFIILGVIGVTALAVLFGFIVMWLWNALMPNIFSLPEVSYWQAVGLVVLSHIFFGSHNTFSNRGSRRSKRNNSDENHVYINKNSDERHWDSFREFWNDYGRDAFDKWLNGKEPATDQTADAE